MMDKARYKQIVVKIDTYNSLKGLKEEGLSMDGLIKRLIKVYESEMIVPN